MKNKKPLIGIIIFILLILAIIAFKKFTDSTGSIRLGNLTTVYVATGGGKEDFLQDPDINKILQRKLSSPINNMTIFTRVNSKCHTIKLKTFNNS